MARKIKRQEEARIALEKGISQVARAVSGTLGPKGRNVVLDKSNVQGTCIVTNDGVSIARDIQLIDPYENQGAQLLIEAASKTNDMVGDGTTTSIVLSYAMAKEGLKNLAANANPMVMRKGIKKAAHEVIEYLTKHAAPIKNLQEIKKIAAISSGDEEIGNIIGNIMEEITPQGFITLEDSKTMQTQSKVIKGMRLKSGYISRYMCTDKTQKIVEYHNPYLLITDQIIENAKSIIPILEKVVKNKRSLLVVAKEITGDAITTLVVNNVKGIFQAAGIQAPGFGKLQKDVLEDLAVMTGGVCVSSELGMAIENITIEMLGVAEKVQIDSENTVIFNGHGSASKIEKRVKEIQKKLDEPSSEFDKERFRERISKLSNGIGVIQVGAVTEIEMLENKLRIEDAISATKAAVSEGILPGGGASYVHAAKELDVLIQNLEGDEKTGAIIVQKALKAPLFQIAENAGINGSVVIDKVESLDFEMGFDAFKERYVNLLEEGIIDALKVSKISLINASSVVSALLTSEAVNIILPGTEETLPSMPHY